MVTVMRWLTGNSDRMRNYATERLLKTQYMSQSVAKEWALVACK